MPHNLNEDSPAGLQIRLFGGLQIFLKGQPLTRFISNKVPALLAYLVVTGRSHTRDTLATLLWGNLPEADAKNNLRQSLFNLRQSIEPYLIVTRDTVAFDTSQNYFLDVDQFARQTSPHRPAEQSLPLLQEAISLYTGDFLAGVFVRDAPEFEDWALNQRTRWHDLALQTLQTLVNDAMNRAAYPAAIAQAGRLLTLDPWREDVHRQLMLAQARLGNLAQALRQYELCNRMLWETFQVEPSGETKALHRRIRLALHEPRHQLPAQLTPLVGRKAELALIQQRLADPTCRLLTLIGPGGVGKTRLALEASGRSEQAFLNGVCFVPLASVNPAQPDSLLLALTDGLRLVLTGAAPPRQQLIEQLAAKELLLVLDNLEHLLAQIGWFNDLLQKAPHLKILATSRERLKVTGEWVIPLSGLPTNDLNEAGQLFVLNGQRVQPHFHLDEQNRPAVAEICRLVEGLPLGIELASAWVDQLSCPEIAQEIVKSLDFLRSSGWLHPGRQQSLQAVFNHSWNLLTPAEKQVFPALAIFRGRFSWKAAQQVTGISGPLLHSLVDKSLVRRPDKQSYELHEVIRQYANQKLGEESGREFGNRHAAYYAHWLAKQEAHLFTPQEGAIFQTIMAEHDNLRAYWQWALAQGQFGLLEQGLKTMATFYATQGRFQEAAGWLEQTSAELGNFPEAGRLLNRVQARWATACLRGNNRPQAESLFQQALAGARVWAIPADLGFVLLNMGYFTVTSGRYDLAHEQFSESLAQYRLAADQKGIANALSALGALSNVTGDVTNGRRYLEESVAISRQIEDEAGLRSSLTNLGNLFFLQKDYPQAATHYQAVLPLCQKAGDRHSEAIIWSNLGAIAFETGQFDQAETLLQRGVAVFQEQNSLQALLQSKAMLSAVYRMLGKVAEAKAELSWILHKIEAEQLLHLLPDAVYEVALLFLKVGQPAKTLNLLHWVRQNPISRAEIRQGAEKQIAELGQMTRPGPPSTSIDIAQLLTDLTEGIG